MAVRSLSIALTGATDAPQPTSLQRTGLWSDEGRQVRVQHVEDVTPVPRDEAVALGPGEAPFDRRGWVTQGYLWPLTPSFGQQLVARLDPEFDRRIDVAAHTTPLELDPMESSGRTVPLEAGKRLRYEQVITAARREAVRNEWSLVDRLVAHLDVEATRREYRLANSTVLWSDLWVEEGRTVVEAKESAGRGAIREAIGQLYDDAHKEGGGVRGERHATASGTHVPGTA